MVEKGRFESVDADLAPPSIMRRISWGAIFAGTTAAIAVVLLLELLGTAIGAATINPLQGRSPGLGLAVGAAIWFVASCMIALFIGGWIAGRLAGIPNKLDGALHGFVTWALTSLALVYLVSTAAGGLLGGAGSLLGQTASLAGRGAQAATPAVTGIVAQATGITPQQVQTEAGEFARDPNFQAFVAGVVKNGQVTPQDRQALVNLLVNRRRMSPEEASATINRWQSQIEQGAQQAKQAAAAAATAAASGIAKGAFGSFCALLLGLVTALVGGQAGTPKLLPPRAALDTRIAA